MSDEIIDYKAGIAANVRRIREAKGLSQVQVTMATGIPQTSISKIERKGGPFTFVNAYRIAHALGVTIHDLIPAQSDDVIAALEEDKAAIA